MKFFTKGIATAILVTVGTMLSRNASVGLTNEMALLQMQNVNFVPNLTNTYTYTNVAVWIIVALLICMLWKKDVKQIKQKYEQEKGE